MISREETARTGTMVIAMVSCKSQGEHMGRCGEDFTRGPQQGEILDAGAEIRDPKSQAIYFPDYFCKIKILREI